MAKVQPKKDKVESTDTKILNQLYDINQNTMDSIDVNKETKTAIENLIQSINTLKEATSKAAVDSATDEKIAIRRAVDQERLNKLKIENQESQVKANALEQKTKEDAELRRIRLEQAKFSLERSKLLATQQDQDRAERLARAATMQIQQDRASAAENSPLAKMGNSIQNAKGGFFPSTLLSLATGGIINPAVANMLGIDKLFSAGIGAVKNKVNTTLGQRAQQKQELKDRQAADEKAIESAVHAAELNKRIDDILSKKGLKQNDAGQSERFTGNPIKKNDSAIKENPNRGIEERLDKIHTTLKEMSKEKPKEEKKEDGIFEKMLSGLGSIISSAISNVIPALAGALALAIGGLLGIYLADKAVNKLEEDTGAFGAGAAKASMESAAFINRKDVKEYNDRAGAYAGFAQVDTYINTSAASTESGWLWGKNEEAIATHRTMRANAAKDALKYDGKQKIVDQIENDVENGKMSREEADELLIKHAREGVTANRKANQGKDIAEIQKENVDRVENYKIAENNARNQTYNLFNGQTTQLDVENPGEQMTQIQNTMSDVVSTEDSKILIKTDTINMNSGGISTAGSITGSSKSPALRSEARYSEDTMTRMNTTAQSTAQAQRLENSINNTTNNSSNIQQTNITQHSETGVYATGDAARTMIMN